VTPNGGVVDEPITVEVAAGVVTDLGGLTNEFASSATVQYDIDPPAVTTTQSDAEAVISESDADLDSLALTLPFTVTATFDEAMDTGIDPVVTFTGAIGDTFGSAGDPIPTPDAALSGWMSSTVFEAVYDVDDDDVMETIVAKR